MSISCLTGFALNLIQVSPDALHKVSDSFKTIYMASLNNSFCVRIVLAILSFERDGENDI
jgi:hypothetical protein